MRCWEIADRYRTEFRKELDVYKQRPKNGMIISIPNVLRIEEECHNFLYEAKSFVRDVLQAFNVPVLGLSILRNGEKARSAGLFCPTISRLLTRMGSRGTGDSQSP
jgi:hypothetical protein